LVCTAGLLDGEKWIRIYPVPYTFLSDGQKYPKYSWLVVDLARNHKDPRPESYRPENDKFTVIEQVGTSSNWAERKQYIIKDFSTSMKDLIARAKSDESKSLATLKPLEITDFVIEEDEREWKQTWLDQLKQYNLFDTDESGQGRERKLIRKLPYKFSYRFLSDGDDKPHQMMIEDWEVGMLFWNCLKRTDGDEFAAKQLVKQKYFDEFTSQKDLYFFVGTTRQYHSVAPNPFVIIGVFYPPKTSQLPLF